ncbi:uncharacterized protein ACA1_139910 [Acanthamoeba castellanii str. Neff]|uniref:Uncharacterized protein n=1 Tax=Acanthamoeba castellanii (strain ATCC 30010 / Neff) TaxID=1257118 RepID=L8GHC3_ACACF|nr:uncharacterized protein ACA1_139910 [Acanthamoeba castellanii str. Neff]ELR12128.1 hypothetical protein ACA1_139910 [Acanthamoeba castellanii str. Neff]
MVVVVVVLEELFDRAGSKTEHWKALSRELTLEDWKLAPPDAGKGEQLRSCLRLANVLQLRSLAAQEPSLLGPDKPELPPLHTRPAGLASLVKACPELAPELVDALALSL